MTTTSRYRVTCPCGHEGIIKMRENDAPYSKPWESYLLEGLEGGSTQNDGFLDWPEVFERIKPACPICGTNLTPEHLKDK